MIHSRTRALTVLLGSTLASAPLALAGSGDFPLFTDRDLSGAFLAPAIALADFNTDGALDVLSSNQTGTSLVWQRSDGAITPSFTTVTINNDNVDTVGIGRIDNDTTPDPVAVTLTLGGPELRWYANSGGDTPVFTPSVVPVSTIDPRWMIVAEIDGDAGDDIAIAGFDGSLLVYENAGGANPTFTEHPVSTSLASPWFVAAGDIDGDTDTDLAAVGFGEDALYWYENNGGVWTEHTVPGTLSGPRSVDICDMNGDGAQDIIVASSGSTEIAIYFNNGAMSPVFEEVKIGVSPFLGRAACMDVDDDSDMDIVWSGSSTTLAWFESNGAISPAFTLRELPLDPSRTDAESFAIGDLNADGAPDLAAGYFPGSIWFESARATNLGSSNSFLRLGAAIEDATPGDAILASPVLFDAEPALDTLGKPLTLFSSGDILRSTGAPTSLDDASSLEADPAGAISLAGPLDIPAAASVSFSGDTISLEPTSTTTLGAGAALALTPVTNAALDGDLQLGTGAQITVDGPAVIPGGAGFSRRFIPTGTGTSFFQVHIEDLDDDGDDDIIGIPDGTTRVSWFDNDGAAVPTFTERDVTNAAALASAITVADLNNDGDLDVVVGSAFFPRLRWFESDGATPPVFTEHAVISNTIPVDVLVSGDMDADGDRDFIAAHRNTDILAWYENDGVVPPSFTEHIIPSDLGEPAAFALADIDADGDVDFFAGSTGDAKLAWFRSTGTNPPEFLQETITAGNVQAGVQGVAARDMDGDGDIDCVAGSAFNSRVFWFENNGAVNPGFTEHIIVTGFELSSTVADFDGDGDPDVLVANQNNDRVVWMENDGAAPPMFTQNFVADGVDVWSLGASDVNADGAVDFVAGTGSPDILSWFENAATGIAALSSNASIDVTGTLGISNKELRLTAGADVSATGDIELDRNASLSGNGSVAGDVFSAGTVRVNSSDAFVIDGNYTQSVGVLGDMPGAMDADLSTGAPGVLDVTGSIFLDGTLRVSAPPGFDASVGSMFTLALASTPVLPSTFDVALLPGLPDNKFFRVVYDNTETSFLGSGGTVTLLVDSLSNIVDVDNPDTFSAGGTPTGAELGDIGDGQGGGPDGLLDLVVTIPDPIDPVANPGSVVVLFNQPTTGTIWPGFSAGTAQFFVGNNPTDVAIGDFDSANGADIAVVNSADDEAEVLLNNANDTLMSDTVFTINESPTNIVAVDLDGDFLDDLAASGDVLGGGAGAPGIASVALNQGGAGDNWDGFRPPQNFDVGVQPVVVETGNVDGDKWEDLYVVNSGSNSVTVLRNLGSSGSWMGFGPGVGVPVGNGPVDIGVADLDGDKWEDFITTDRNSGTLTVAINDQLGNLAAQPALPMGTAPSSITIADLDTDGDNDAAVVLTDTNGDRVVRVLRNDLASGNLAFAPSQDLLSGQGPVLILSGNIDTLGPDDLVAVTDATGAGAASITLPGGRTGKDHFERRSGQRSTTVPLGPGGDDVAVLLTGGFGACPGDADGNGSVNINDISYVIFRLGNSGPPGGVEGDADNNGIVDANDISFVIFRLGDACP